jgi:hypothetical protein
MLKKIVAAVLLTSTALGGCASKASRPSGPPFVAPRLRAAWLGLVADEIEALRACVDARAPERAVAAHVQLLDGAQVGIVTLGEATGAERCVFGDERVVFRVRARDLSRADFAGRPVVWASAARPEVAQETYLEEVVSQGRTVAWVQWLAEDER